MYKNIYMRMYIYICIYKILFVYVDINENFCV